MTIDVLFESGPARAAATTSGQWFPGIVHEEESNLPKVRVLIETHAYFGGVSVN
jgi:hypothetical protein